MGKHNTEYGWKYIMNLNFNKAFAKGIIHKLGSTGFFHVFGSSAINKVIGFASSIVIVRLISKSEYGIFSYANNLLNFFMIICGLGAASGILQICSEQRDELEKIQFYGYACRSSFIVNCFLSFIILWISIFIPFKIEGANDCLFIMSFLPIFSYVYEMQIFYLRTQRRNKEYSYSNTFSTLVIFVLTCILSSFFQVKGLVAAKYIAFVASSLFVLCRYKIGYPLIKKSRISSEMKKQFWGISLITTINNGMSSLMYMLDVLVLGIVVPDSTVIASYKLATTIPTALAFIPTAFVTYIYPYFALHRDDKSWVKRKYTLVAGALTFFSSAIGIFLFVFAPFIISILFGKEYLDAVPCFRILSISFVISSVLRVLPGNILVTQRRLKFNLFISILSSVLNTVLNVIFIMHWQSIGAAYATLLTFVVTGIINTAYLLYVLNNDKEYGKDS